jgi:hypothetical protein
MVTVLSLSDIIPGTSSPPRNNHQSNDDDNDSLGSAHSLGPSQDEKTRLKDDLDWDMHFIASLTEHDRVEFVPLGYFLS